MIRVIFLVDQRPRLDLGTEASEQHLPVVGETVVLKGEAYVVSNRTWTYEWSSKEFIPLQLQVKVDIDLRASSRSLCSVNR